MQNYHLKPNMRLQFLLIFLFIGCNSAEGQNDILMVNAITYNAKKYKEYHGSPYLWKENKKVTIYDINAKEYSGVFGNYNVLENEFEVYRDDSYILLPHSRYICIKVIDDPDISYSLYSNVHPKLKNKYCIRHAQTANYSVYESRTAKQRVVEVQTPGVPTKFNKINSRSYYYLIIGNKLIPFKISKKKIIKKFGHKKEINAFIKDQKIKIKEMEDVVLLFGFLDSKGWLEVKD